MAEEIKPIIKVDTGDSQKTVKSLKKEISDLKDQILNLTKGTKEYDEAVEQLQQAQRELNEVQALTKKTATALDGSYDALTHRMALLKKEWRATADEARRAELGKEIDEINQQLKEMDASVGNFQRNVGNYVSHWEGMPEVTKDFGVAMREMNEQIEPTKQKFESVGKMASGLAAGFATVQGAAALLGIENENLEQTMVKLQASIALVQGAKGIGDLVEGVGKAKVAFQGLGTTIKGVSKAMGATGWIAVIVAVTAAVMALVSWMKKTKNESEDLDKKLEKLSDKHSKLGSSIGSAVGQYTILQRQFKNLKTDVDKQKWIDENAQAFSSLGLAINDVNDAQKAFIENSEDVINALKLQAEASALSSMYEDEYGKAYAKKKDLEARRDAISAGYDPTKEEEKGAGLEAGDWQTYQYQQSSIYGSTGTYSTQVLPTINSSGAEKLKEYYNQQIAAVNAETGSLLEELVTIQQQAAEAAANVGLKTKDTKTVTKILTKEEALALAKQELMTTLEENLDDVEITVSASVQIQKEGEIYKKAKTALSAIDKTYNDLAKKNNEDIADYEVTIEERKLAKLQELYQQAEDAKDWTSQTLLLQEIADQEIEIEKAKYEEMYRLRSEYATKTTNAISQASQITQGILEITQASFEKDGEITEKEAKRIKRLQIAIATMNMLQGITSALAGVFTTHTGVWDIAMAAAQATSIAAAGTANIMKIKNTDLTGSVPSGAMGAVTPNSNIYGTDLPMSYVRNVTTASETDALNQDNRVYILESDIQASNKKVQVRENESSF